MTDEPKNKILYVAPQLSSFISSDISSLSERYHVVVNNYNWKKTINIPLYFIRQFFFLLRHLRKSKAVIVSFGGYWALLPAWTGRLSGTPVYIILNGTDCAAIPSVRYGNLRKPMLRSACHSAYKKASGLLPVSTSLIETRNTYSCEEGSVECHQGFRHYFPALKTKTRVVYNGFNTDYWQTPPGLVKDPRTFLAVFSPGQFFLKGGDLILQIAEQFSDCTFYIAGTASAPEGCVAGDNIKFLGRITPDELREYYRKCRYYLQLSIFEGFGCALCEAMLCECIPIGSSVNMIPEIIGDTGLILEQQDVRLLGKLISKALELPTTEEMGKAARHRVIRNYDQKTRNEQLFEIIDQGL